MVITSAAFGRAFAPHRLAAVRYERGLRFIALNRSMSLARSVSVSAAVAFALAGGRGDRRLLGLVLAAAIIGSAVFWAWGRFERSGRDERHALAALSGWTLTAVVLAVAAKDPSSGAYHGETVMAVIAPLAFSFGLVLRPAVTVTWLAIGIVAIFGAARTVTGDAIDALVGPFVLALAGFLAVVGRIGLERLADDRRELAALSRRAAGVTGPGPIAGAIVDEVFGWGRFGLVWLVVFESAECARLLAQRAIDLLPTPVLAGELLPGERARYLCARAEQGPWIEALSADALIAYGVPPTQFAGQHAYMPLESNGELLGLLMVGKWTVLGREEPRSDASPRLADELPLLADVAAITSSLLGPALRDDSRPSAERADLASVIATRAFYPVFQPIVAIGTGTVVGFEALTRFDDGMSPERRFTDASRLGLGTQLELATLGAALEAALRLPGGKFLSVNASPQLATSGELRRALARSSRALTVELTEHAAVLDYGPLRTAIRDLGCGVRLAIDDAGAGYASLRHILELQPEVVKLDRRLISGIDGDPVRQSLVAGLCHFAQDTEFELLAEGIETDAELATLRELGVGLGQGYLLGRPEAAPPIDAVS